MACTRPVAVKRQADSLSTFRTVLVPCGNCLGCDLERSRQWAVRCMHEASLHLDNCFLTLTYDDEHVPPAGSLDRRAFPLFMKRLRKAVAPRKVRYFYCGEYGERFERPHYHAVLFGFWPGDSVRCGARGGHGVYRSDLVGEVWPYGFHEVGSVTFDSAAYVARYVTKKVRGEAAAEHYMAVDGETGELFWREPEFSNMSRRPGIAADWFAKYGGELEPDGTVIQSGKEVPMPRYYRKLMKAASPDAERRLARAAEQQVFVRERKQDLVQLEKNEVFLKARSKLSRGFE